MSLKEVVMVLYTFARSFVPVSPTFIARGRGGDIREERADEGKDDRGEGRNPEWRDVVNHRLLFHWVPGRPVGFHVV